MDPQFETKNLSGQPKNPTSPLKPVGRPILDSATRDRISLGSQPEMSKLAVINEFYRANKWYIWGIGAAVIIIGVLAYFALRPNQGELPEANISITADAPETAASGAEIIYKIKIQNDDAKALAGMELELVYPDNVAFVSSSPEPNNSSGTLLPVPDLLSGQNITLFVKLRLSGSIDESKTVQTKLRYRYKDFSTEFVKESSFSTRLTAAEVALDITGPSNTIGAGVQSFEVSYSNNSENPIENARIQADYPEGFTFAAGNPEPSLSNNTWNVGTLKPGDNGKISFQGSLSGSQAVSATLIVKLLTISQSGTSFVQAESEFTTQLQSLPLVLEQTLEGSRSSEVISPGDTLNFNLTYRNNAQTVAHGVIVTASLDAKALDLGSISAEGGLINNATITWNASGVSNLEQLSPGESGQVRFSVKVKNPPVNDSSEDIKVKSSVKIKANEYETFLPGNDLTIKVRTQAGLSSGLEYVSGELPPRVGNSTTYRVTLSLRNTTSDIANGTLTAFIPLQAGAFDQSSLTPSESSKATFDSATGKLTWKVGSLPAHTGDFTPLKKLSFNLQISPSASQVGDTVLLVRNISFGGLDSFTAESVNLTTDDITTGNTGNSNDGRVRP